MNLQRIAVTLTLALSLAAAAATSDPAGASASAAAPTPAANPALPPQSVLVPSAKPVAAPAPAPAVVPAPVTAPTRAPAASGTAYDPTQPGAVAPVADPAITLPAPSASPLKRIGQSPVASRTKSFLWEVKSPTSTVWLFGTMHVGKRMFYPLPEAVENAFDNSATLVVEADVGKSGAGDINELISYVPPDTLDKNIPKPLFERLRTQLARLQIPDEAVKPMRPFVVGGFLSVVEFSRLGYDMNLGVDAYLLTRAKDAGKPVEELESVRGQLEMLGSMPANLQEAFLDNAVSALELGRSADQVTGMVNAWQTGDMKLMENVTADVNRGMRMSSQLDDIMLHGRHDAMLKKIDGYLAGKGPVFVAVGSLHLVGPRGLVQALKAKGYEVNQK